MRIISQDGNVNMPFEIATVYAEKDGDVWRIYAATAYKSRLMGSYSTGRRADKAMTRMNSIYKLNVVTYQFPQDDDDLDL